MNYAYDIKLDIITLVVENTMNVIDKTHANFKRIKDCLVEGKTEIAYGYVGFVDVQVVHIAKKIFKKVHSHIYFFDGLQIYNEKLTHFLESNTVNNLKKYSLMLDKILLSYVHDKIIDFVIDNSILLYEDGDIMCMHDSAQNYYEDLPNTYHIIPYDFNNSHLPIVKVDPHNIVDIINNSLGYVTTFNNFGVTYV